ncbi:MAG TPA: aldehyde dehydrogenase family protein [Vicinamibacterales bacterium]|nr:aldehyde dehydrogenase family protein [Vicinamibacterales bacterium]
MLHIPILRWGQPYRSVDRTVVPHFRTREPFVEMSLANTGLIRRDLRRQAEMREKLASIAVSDLVRMAKAAAAHFLNDTLPIDPSSDLTQTPQDYVEQVTATTGMPWSNVRRNMLKVHGVLDHVDEVLRGLTRGLDLSVLDAGFGERDGRLLSFFPRTDALGVVLPNNSPGVHALWAPATVLKIPLVLKPGSAEPWTPLRIIHAWAKAGLPAELFGYYPAGHAGGNEILSSTGRGMVFGDVTSTRRWKGDPRVEVHGPGFSKIVIGPDAADQWEKYLDVMVESIANNGGRSCVNASGVWVTKHGDAIADALAARLAKVEPRPADDPEAVLAPFADPTTAERISAAIDQDLYGADADGPIDRRRRGAGDHGGARDVSAAVRGKDRVVTVHGGTYLLPTVIRCDASHALANREFLFPYASVVEVPAASLPSALGPSLVVTCASADRGFQERFVSSPLVDRLNLGAIPTTRIGWDQPHEGNLFDHLYARRSIQRLA